MSFSTIQTTLPKPDFSFNETEEKQANQINLYYDELITEGDMDGRAIEITQDFKNLEERIAQTVKVLTEQFNSTLQPQNLLVSKQESIDYLNQILPHDIQDLIDLLNKINFSRGYENAVLSYPSNEEMDSFIKKVLQTRKQFKIFCRVSDFKESFDNQMQTFLKALKTKICMQAKESRIAQQNAIFGGTLIVEDREYTLACIEGHLAACDEQDDYYWLELRNLLNLQQIRTNPRKCTRQEMDVFMFLTAIYDRIKNKKELD